MKNNLTALLLVVLPLFFTQAQNKIEEDIEKAFQNAKKGIYWALTNIPENKNRIDEDLIADDILYSSVKLIKETSGIKIESVGYNNSNEVCIKIYKSNENLIKEGYLKIDDKKKSDKKSE